MYKVDGGGKPYCKFGSANQGRDLSRAIAQEPRIAAFLVEFKRKEQERINELRAAKADKVRDLTSEVEQLRKELAESKAKQTPTPGSTTTAAPTTTAPPKSAKQ